jgi:hypothetical protein
MLCLSYPIQALAVIASTIPLLEYELYTLEQLHLAAVNSAAYLGSEDALAALLHFGVEVPAQCLSLAASLNRVGCIQSCEGWFVNQSGVLQKRPTPPPSTPTRGGWERSGFRGRCC